MNSSHYYITQSYTDDLDQREGRNLARAEIVGEYSFIPVEQDRMFTIEQNAEFP